MVSIKL